MIGGICLGDVPIAVTRRNEAIDCVHLGSAVLIDEHERSVWACGNRDRLVFERSTTKPFRALELIRSGAVEAFGLDSADIAVIAGSHSGSGIHLERVARILAKASIEPSLLLCPTRLPLGLEALQELATSCRALSPLHSDCSGEHAGALLLCRFHGWDERTYLAEDHPVQVLYRNVVAELSPPLPQTMTVTDRCGMPTSLVPLQVLAIRMLRLAKAARAESSAMRLIASIRENPYLYTGQKRLIGELIARSSGHAIGKCGAEGIYVAVWPDAGYAFAIKVGDGNHRAALPVMQSACNRFNLPLPALWDCVNEGEFASVGSA